MAEGIGLLCTSDSSGGLELNVIRLAGWLTRMGYRVVVLGLAHTPIEQMTAEHDLRFRALEPGPKYLDIPGGRELAKRMRELDLHFIVVNTTADIWRAALAKIFTAGKIRLVYLQNMQIGVKKRDPFHTWVYKRLDAWISPLPFLVRQVAELTRFDARKVHEIPLGIELERFIEAKPDKRSARAALGLPQDVIIAGVIGRIDRQKGQDVLLNAVFHLLHEGILLEILIVGENTLHEPDTYARELKQLCVDLGIERFVHFRPFMPDIEIAHAALDIFVLPSKNETYGLVTVEAMASGLPIIATHSGGTPEIITNHREGLLISPGSVEEMAAALRLLIRFPEMRDELARAARRKAVEQFSHFKQCVGMTELFEQIT